MDECYAAINSLGCLSIVILVVAVVSILYIANTRRRTRWILEHGQCNLPTVVWTPRFMNYTLQDDKYDKDDIDWDDEDSVKEWASKFIHEHKMKQYPTTTTTVQDDHRKKKLGSSSITNILPRMERLNGPYGMYATVYGINTKVIHIAHPIPVRAILTGAGVVDIGSSLREVVIEESNYYTNNGGRLLLFIWQRIWRIVRMITLSNDNDDIPLPKKKKMSPQLRRMSSSSSSSSSHRMLTSTGSTKYPAYDHFNNFFGDGVFTANGSDWKAKRTSVIHCLLRNDNMNVLLDMESNRVADSFIREVENGIQIATKKQRKLCMNEKKIPVMNIVPMLQRSTVGLIYRLITHNNIDFSPNNNTTELSDKRVVDEYSQQNNERVKMLIPAYLQSITKMRMLVLAQSRSLWYLLPPWAYKAFSPMYREESRTMIPIREFAKLACMTALAGSPLALLSQRESHVSTTTTNGQRCNKKSDMSKDLLDEAITLLFAGQDTSAATLSWTLHLLSLHPEKQERVVNEIISVAGGIDAESQSISKQMISRMPYLDAVIKESMRLYPVAPFIVRKLTTDITIPIEDNEDFVEKMTDTRMTTLTMPESTFACIWIYALHRNPKLWYRPDDFLPERWIDDELRNQDSGQVEHGAYIPFAIGPRNCLGQPMAQVILRIALARIIKKYVVIDPRFETLRKINYKDGGINFDTKELRKDMQAGFTVLPSDGLNLRLIERKT